ncbi:unnamed protein product [Adineta steineri]|uniref:Uncharacterized protein n=1 Tax=Adineta steineri TaxID=433720 RepID=A0A815SQB0_9BILA|nr:unnamed protein product [Adineta steineri]
MDIIPAGFAKSEHLQVDKAAHVALLVCAIRMLHGPKLFGHETGLLAHDLLSIYYRDHWKYYDNLENLGLHLHIHYSNLYLNYGSLNNTNCFAQESFLGACAKNKHGTRYWGDLLVHHFDIDFALQKIINQQEVDNVNHNEGAFDVAHLSINNMEKLLSWHKRVCDCNQPAICIIIYHRSIIRGQTYHSLSYPKRQSNDFDSQKDDADVDNDVVTLDTQHQISTQSQFPHDSLARLNYESASDDSEKENEKYNEDDKLSDQYMYEDTNLLRTVASSFGDFARKTMRLVFSQHELTTQILPPQRHYLARTSLNEKKFELVNDAIRIKFKIDSTKYAAFHKNILRRKLSDFLIEERRRGLKRIGRDHIQNETMENSS